LKKLKINPEFSSFGNKNGEMAIAVRTSSGECTHYYWFPPGYGGGADEIAELQVEKGSL
jgi:hypothetical protein